MFNHLVKANPAPADSHRAEHEERLLEKAQKILDRVLFICFCEDRGLLPHGIIRGAIQAAGTGFVLTTRWQQMVGLFDAINTGRPALKINAYNGGLFAKDEELDALVVSDEALDDYLRLSSYDFETDLNVNILGRIFEQSISDLVSLAYGLTPEGVDLMRKTAPPRMPIPPPAELQANTFDQACESRVVAQTLHHRVHFE